MIDGDELANKADSADEALVIDDANKAGAYEADEATDVTGANEANVIDKPSKADKAKAKAEEAKGHDQAKGHG